MHSFWLEHYQNFGNIIDTKLNLSGPRVAFWQTTYYLKCPDNAPNHQRFKQITKYYTKQWTLENVDVGLMSVLVENVSAVWNGDAGYNIWFEMWVLVQNVGFGFTWFGRKRLFSRSGTEATFWEQVSWPTFNQGFRHCSRIWTLRWWTQSHHFAQMGDTAVN